MAKVSQAAKIGLFVVVAAGAGYLVYSTVHRATGKGGGYVVHAYLKDATGIAKHSRVTIAGIPVGSVDDIRLENGRARVDVRVNGDTLSVSFVAEDTLGIMVYTFGGDGQVSGNWTLAGDDERVYSETLTKLPDTLPEPAAADPSEDHPRPSSPSSAGTVSL